MFHPPPSYLKDRTGQVPIQTSSRALLICHKAVCQAIQAVQQASLTIPQRFYFKDRTGQVPLQTSGRALLSCHKAACQAVQQASLPPPPLTSRTGRASSRSS